eukprot:scaffold9261_cov109-Cylindrotheca_fusiformis.AAC.1
MDPPATRAAAVFTAMAVHADLQKNDDDEKMLTQPLLEIQFDKTNDDDDEALKPQKRTKQEKEEKDIVDNELHRKALFIGILTGATVHAIALSAYALMVTYYGYSTPPSSSTINPTTSTGDWLFHLILSFLTQIDLMVYALIWMAFTCTMTRSGMKWIQDKFPMNNTKNVLERRYVFVIGVYFLIGVVLGAFIAWGIIDCYLGFMVPILPIALTVLVDLVLCYLMIWCYDAGSDLPPSSPQQMEEDDNDDHHHHHIVVQDGWNSC